MPEVLTAETGRVSGSRASNRLRRAGKVPAVVYGLGMEPVSLAVTWADLRRTLVDGGLTSAIRLRVDGREHLTIVRDMQRHPVRRDITHIDFLAVDPDQPVTLDVPVVIGGLEEDDDAADLMVVTHSLAVAAKPAALPNEIVVDGPAAREAGVIRVADVQLPEGVTTEADAELVLVEVVSTELLALPEDEAAEAAEGAEAEGAEAGSTGSAAEADEG
jgi:large subunit ribosomal protein L25